MDFIVHFDTGEPVTVKDAKEAEVRDGILHINGGPKVFPLVAAFKEWTYFQQVPQNDRVINEYNALMERMQAKWLAAYLATE